MFFFGFRFFNQRPVRTGNNQPPYKMVQLRCGLRKHSLRGNTCEVLNCRSHMILIQINMSHRLQLYQIHRMFQLIFHCEKL